MRILNAKKTSVDKKSKSYTPWEIDCIYIYIFKNKYNGFFISSVYDIGIIVICNSIKPTEYRVGIK